MALVRTPDQRLIAETARAFLQDEAGSLPRRRVLDAGEGFDEVFPVAATDPGATVAALRVYLGQVVSPGAR